LPLQIIDQFALRLQRRLRRLVTIDQDLAVVLEELVVGVGHAEQFADHQHGGAVSRRE
jgi:hypothetical protein